MPAVLSFFSLVMLPLRKTLSQTEFPVLQALKEVPALSVSTQVCSSKETGNKTQSLNVCGTAQMMKQRFQIRFSGDGDEERMKEE